jgi:hypothetical protein
MNSSFLGRTLSLYRYVALLLFNTLVILVVLNVALAAVFYVRDSLTPRVIGPLAFPKPLLARVYPHLKEDQWTALIEETWTRPVSFESFTHFRETPSSGQYVNVSEGGYRSNRSAGPWPPRPDAFNVFFFGGSTTFGYGIRDDETIPSVLQDLLASRGCGGVVHVYNFGRGYYYSSQEQILLMRLLARGFIPQLAVFLDGINESRWGVDEPHWSEHFGEFLRQQATGEGASLRLGFEVPMVRAARSLRSRVQNLVGNDSPASAELPRPRDGNTTELAARDVARYLRNQQFTKVVADGFDVETLFAWQPSPAHNYDLAHHLFPLEPSLRELGGRIYAEFSEKHAGDGEDGRDILWLGDIQKARTEPLYVDGWHYSAAFSREIAGHLANAITSRGLICGDSAKSTPAAGASITRSTALDAPGE